MPLPNIDQSNIISITATLRLRQYDGHYELFLPGYQNPTVYQNSEGIFDETRIPNLDYVKGMCNYLQKVSELYYIEILESGLFVPIGDVTIKPDNPPIAIWFDQYHGKGIGKLVMQTLIHRLRALGYSKITGSMVYRWNIASQKLHEGLGFVRTDENEREITYELDLNP